MTLDPTWLRDFLGTASLEACLALSLLANIWLLRKLLKEKDERLATVGSVTLLADKMTRALLVLGVRQRAMPSDPPARVSREAEATSAPLLPGA